MLILEFFLFDAQKFALQNELNSKVNDFVVVEKNAIFWKRDPLRTPVGQHFFLAHFCTKIDFSRQLPDRFSCFFFYFVEHKFAHLLNIFPKFSIEPLLRKKFFIEFFLYKVPIFRKKFFSRWVVDRFWFRLQIRRSYMLPHHRKLK